MGVLDLLPSCVSSVYLFYDPKFEHWELGKISALNEIALARRLHRDAHPSVQWYYMGRCMRFTQATISTRVQKCATKRPTYRVRSWIRPTTSGLPTAILWDSWTWDAGTVSEALHLHQSHCPSRSWTVSYRVPFLLVLMTLTKSCSMGMITKFLLWLQGVQRSSPSRCVPTLIEH